MGGPWCSSVGLQPPRQSLSSRQLRVAKTQLLYNIGATKSLVTKTIVALEIRHQLSNDVGELIALIFTSDKHTFSRCCLQLMATAHSFLRTTAG